MSFRAMHPESPREKNVKCDQCNKLFLTKSGLRKHVAVEHSDEWKKNRAQCSICYVVFRGKVILYFSGKGVV